MTYQPPKEKEFPNNNCDNCGVRANVLHSTTSLGDTELCGKCYEQATKEKLENA